MILTKKEFELLKRYIKPYRIQIFAISFLAIICAFFEAINLGTLVPLLQLMDGTEDPGGMLWSYLTWGFSIIGVPLNFTYLLIIIALLFLIGQMLLFTKKKMQARLWFGFSSDLKKTLFSESIRTDISYHHSHKAGDIIDLITRQSENGANIVYTLTEIMTYLFFILVYTIMLIYISVQMTIVCIIIAVTSLYFLNYYVRISKKIGQDAVDVNMQMNSFVNERFHLVKLISIFSTENVEDTKFKKIRDTYATVNSKLMINGIKIETIFQIIIFFIAIIILYIATIYLQIALPLLLVFIFILIRLTDPLRQLNAQRHTISTQMASLEKVDEVLDSIMHENTVVDGKEPFTGFSDAISVRDVTFSYDKITPVLNRMDFAVQKNQMVALVGASGGGKTTIVDLIIRMMDPKSGSICIDGQNIRNFTLESYHKHIGFVSQESYLFNDTILNNICYGSNRVSEAEAIDAARQANAHDFILELPDKYQTVLGEKGTKLSGGQKQRLSLARALYRKPDILILDEATSALDSESEKIIQDSIAQLKNRYTIIAIAHRLSTIRAADKIFVIEKGHIVETGTHDTLINNKGTYANYYQIQYGTGNNKTA